MDTVVLEFKGKMLLNFAMEGKWEEVIEIYKEERALRNAKITASGDTALHMAVSDGNEKVVAKMVELLVGKETIVEIDVEKSALDAENWTDDVAVSGGNDVVVTVKSVGEESALDAENEIKNERPGS